MTTRPSNEMRRQVVERAGSRCEYCLLSQDFAASTHQVDHVIAEKHGGKTELNNLALSCSICNRRKASDIASLDPETNQLVALYNPRCESWIEHFEINGERIVGRTATGRTTIHFLQLNAPERLLERRALIVAGRFPPSTLGRKPK